MTAGTKPDHVSNGKTPAAKKRRRLMVLIAALCLVGFCLFRWTTFDGEVAAEQHAKTFAGGQPAAAAGKAVQDKENGRPKGKVVYLTFDDGPSDWTGKILDVLDQQGVKATFFMQGSQLKHQNLQKFVKRAVREGHYVGGHSMTHQYKKLYDQKQFVPEMKENLALIHDLTGENPHLVRPPYGSAPGLEDRKLRDQIAKEGIKIWDWTIDSNDWKLKDHPEQIVENIKKATKVDLEVVLLHEKPQTLQVLPEIIAFYQKKGYRFGVYNDDEHFHMNFQKDHRL
ncbi:polysaccharide deacetylase family protein [Paenibacillus sp. VCA1]|nr:polysaccharide deacetylase family protein [Paenibacillus sp. VCA1]MDR9854245.1 polysaccharide deacetylase family protein [Paenibacillus sp. VCA1]